MSVFFTPAEGFKRITGFPVNVSRLYISPRRRFPYKEQALLFNKYEITIRLDSDNRICQDVIDGEVMNIPFPNVVFKSPGMKIQLGSESPREAIGFCYSGEHIKLLKQWKMLPDIKFAPIRITPALDELFNKLRNFSMTYPSMAHPGDVIDGICFNILHEMTLNSMRLTGVKHTPEMRIKEAELYVMHHYDENINFDELASRFDFSHSGFYQYWKSTHNCTPHHFLEELKLRNAAMILIKSALPVSKVVKEVGFSGNAAFYRKFNAYFGVTPKEFRNMPELYRKFFPLTWMDVEK